MDVDVARLAALHEEAAEEQWVTVGDFSINTLCNRSYLIEIESKDMTLQTG